MNLEEDEMCIPVDALYICVWDTCFNNISNIISQVRYGEDEISNLTFTLGGWETVSIGPQLKEN